MYLLIIMAIRPDALPTDLAALTEMVLALDAENEKLRVAMQTLKEMMFGKRSERLAALVAEQLALELDDLESGVTPPAWSRTRRRARVARAVCTRSARMSAKCWT
jgi:transposase